MRTIKQTYASAGESHRWNMVGTYFRLLEVPLGVTVDIRLLKNGAEHAAAVQVDAGYSYKAPLAFDGIEITASGAGQVKFALSDGTGTYDRTIASVSVSSGSIAVSGGSIAVSGGNINASQLQAGTLTNSAPSMVGTTAAQVLAASAAAQGVYFRAADNNTDTIYLGGAGVTEANAVIRLRAGDMFIDDTSAAAAWYAISGSANQSLLTMRGA